MTEPQAILICNQCGFEGFPDLGWQKFSNGTDHLAAVCPVCERHIQYVPQIPMWLVEAPTRPRQPQLL